MYLRAGSCLSYGNLPRSWQKHCGWMGCTRAVTQLKSKPTQQEAIDLVKRRTSRIWLTQPKRAAARRPAPDEFSLAEQGGREACCGFAVAKEHEMTNRIYLEHLSSTGATRRIVEEYFMVRLLNSSKLSTLQVTTSLRTTPVRLGSGNHLRLRTEYPANYPITDWTILTSSLTRGMDFLLGRMSGIESMLE